jgi:1,2-phenylacetyl-CoA epoxidase PaaB subunit
MEHVRQMTETVAPVAIVPSDFKAKILATFDENFGPYVEQRLALYKQSAALAAQVSVTDAATLAIADNLCKALLLERDGLEAVRLSGPGALNSLGRELGKRFKPLFDEIDVPIANLRQEIGAYLVAERRKQSENYQAAAALHAAGAHGAAQEALALASSAETVAPQGTSAREVWAVERYEQALMMPSTPTHPGLVPDEPAIKAYLAKLPISEEPALPGVICKRVPAVVQRRNREDS